MSFVELKPDPNDKDMLNVEYIQQCKIKLETPKHKGDRLCGLVVNYYYTPD
jgi:hypothetical protein